MTKNFLFAVLTVGILLFPSMGHALPEKDFYSQINAIIGKLPKGHNVLIPGTCDGMVMGVVFLKDCKVE